MQSLPGERILFASPTGNLRVTTHRVRYERLGGGTAVIKSIMLEEVASCAMLRRTYPLLLVLAFVCLFGGTLISFSAGLGAFVAGVIFAVVLFVAYLLSGEHVVAIASAGATIFVNVRQWKAQEVRDLIDQIEAAKNVRYIFVKAQPVGTARPS